MKYSQNNEQEIISNFFNGRIGHYLDIGAFDGVKMSNTLALAELGWTGTAIEASPWVFKRLKANYEERDLTSRVLLIEAAAVPDSYPDQLKFYETHRKNAPYPGQGVGSFSIEHAHKEMLKNEHICYSEILETIVNTIKVKDIFNNNDKFMSLDVESFNLELMVSIPWKILTKLELFCVEADTAQWRFVNFMKPLGWKLHTVENFNLFFERS